MLILMYHKLTKDNLADIHAASEAQFNAQISWLSMNLALRTFWLRTA